MRISPDYVGEMPTAQIEMFSIGYYNYASGESKWQYIGSPVSENISAKSAFPKSLVYSWHEDIGEWVNDRSKLKLQPFVGYITSQPGMAEGRKISFNGHLVDGREEIEVPLSYTPGSPEAGLNVLANSFAAPIDISRLEVSDFPAEADATINLFNTGSNADIAGREGEDVDVDAAGQYISIPVGNASYWASHAGYPIVIPSMQGFYVTTRVAGNLRLNYEKLIWNADYSTHPNKPLRVQARNAENDEISGALQITLSSVAGSDKVNLLESESYSTSYENGFDARKIMSGENNIFTIEDEDILAADATSSIVGTRIGVRTGEQTMYDFRFSRIEG